MTNTINIITLLFEYLEDDLNFEYRLTDKKLRGTNFKIITYYSNNITIQISISNQLKYFTLNLITEKENSFTITSQLNKLVYQGNCQLNEYVIAKKELNLLLNK